MTDHLHHLAAAHAVDALDADERRAFETHVPTCPVCTDEVAEYREVAAALAGASAEVPPADLRQRLLDQVADTRQVLPRRGAVMDELASRRRLRRGLRVTAAAAALILAVVVGATAFDRDGDNDRTPDVAAIAAEPDARLVPLSGEGGMVSVIWSPGREQVAVVGSDVAAVADDRTYELWLLDDAGAVPAGLFRPDDDGRVVFVGDIAGAPTGWGITVEPAGGSPAPTGEILFATDT